MLHVVGPGSGLPVRLLCVLIIRMRTGPPSPDTVGGSDSDTDDRRDPTGRVAASIWRSDRDAERCVDMTASSKQLHAPRELKRFSMDSSAESPAVQTEQSVSSKQLHAPREFGPKGTGEIPPVDANASSKQLHAPRELKRGCSDHSVQGEVAGESSLDDRPAPPSDGALCDSPESASIPSYGGRSLTTDGRHQNSAGNAAGTPPPEADDDLIDTPLVAGVVSPPQSAETSEYIDWEPPHPRMALLLRVGLITSRSTS